MRIKPTGLIAGLLASLLLAACSSKPVPSQAQSDAPLATPIELSEKSLRERAMELFRQGKPLEAAPLLKELAAAEPTADNYSDLSYAYLLGKQYKLSEQAADEALSRNSDHAGALYNGGMAKLELDRYSDAVAYLNRSARLQPDRYEPQLAMARAYAAMREGPLARYHVLEAERLGASANELSELKPAVSALFDNDVKDPPSNLADKCGVLKEAALCVAANQSGDFSLYFLPSEVGRKAQRISLGDWMASAWSVDRATLPGGVDAYWVREQDAMVDIYQWHLFAIREGRLQPVIFVGGRTLAADLVRSFQKPPEIRGDTILGTAFTADRSDVINSVWKLSPDLSTANFVSETIGHK